MKISNLLNPLSHCRSDNVGYRSSESPTPPTLPRSVGPITAPKRQKVPKDAMILTEGSKAVGLINFPPHEAGNNKQLGAEHRRFRISPMGEIGKYYRHIPYTSDKKDFKEKTGRDAFEVYQYRFKVPGEDREYTVLWDYNIGLVRVTPFFKALKYSKTTPARVLNLNPGLRDICYSITGGALVGQGYWMPYDVAKAVGATFCYEIRHALTPIFGEDFISMCIPPDDPNFAKFIIEPSIVQACTEQTNQWRTRGTTVQPSPATRSKKRTSPSTPKTQFACPTWSAKSQKKTRTKEHDLESGYGTDTDQSDKLVFSPQISPRSQVWTSINQSRSPTDTPRSSPAVKLLFSPTSAYYGDEKPRPKRTFSKVIYGDVIEDDIPRSFTMASEGLTDGEESGWESGVEGRYTEAEIDAASIMLQLKDEDSSLQRPKRTRAEPGY